MSVWSATSVDQTPKIKIIRWTIREITKSDQLPINTHHIVGYNSTEGEGRVSSAIESFDKETLVATTGSGRLYQLNTDPAINMDAEYVWQRWCQINDVQDWIDVTDQYYIDPLEISMDETT